VIATDVTATPVVVVAAVAAVAALASIWFWPRAHARRWENRGVTGRDLAEIENGFRTALIQAIGGVALLATFAVTWIQISDSRRASERTLALTERGQITDRFTRAIASLGATGSNDEYPLEQRLGGIYGLRRVAIDAPGERATVVAIMDAYLREHHVRHGDVDPVSVESDFFYAVRDWCGPSVPLGQSAAADAEAALQVAGSFGPRDVGRRRRNLGGLALDHAQADGAQLQNANLRGTSLRFSRLENADLSGTRISGMFASFSCLRGASLNRAEADVVDLQGSNLARATLRGTILNTSKLMGVCLEGADLSGANLASSDLTGADLTGAKLVGTDLRDADLRRVDGLTEEQLGGAATNGRTRLPAPGRTESPTRACRKDI
jgi:uncharacterized protein YjbI with pentapeptide repeats